MSHTHHLHDAAPAPSAAERAIAEMRALLGSSGPASRWRQLSVRQRKIICAMAGLSQYLAEGDELGVFDVAQREAIRRALMELAEVTALFQGNALVPAEWRKSCRSLPVVEQAAIAAPSHPLHERLDLLKTVVGSGQ